MIDDMEYNPGETPLEPDELAGLRFAHITTRDELNQLEQANIQDGLIWLAGQNSPDLLTDHFVRELHRRLFGQVWKWAGSYRLTEKNIGEDPRYITVRLRDLLADVAHWVEHDVYAPLEIAVRFHHRLVKLHPFPNGNGRCCRIIADALLQKHYKGSPINWEGGNKGEMDLGVNNERRQQYLAALRAADSGDYSLLFEFAGHLVE